MNSSTSGAYPGARVLVIDPAPDEFAVAELEALQALGVDLVVNTRRIRRPETESLTAQRFRTVDFDAFDEAELIDALRDHAPDILKFRAGIPLTGRVLRAASPAPGLVVRAAAGLDNIDRAAARELGVTVASVPGANASAVAEYVVGTTVQALRSIPARDRLLHSGDWGAATDRLPARQLSDCAFGVVGGGHIGTRVVSLVTAFGAEVLWLPSVRHPVTDRGAPGVTVVHSLEEMLGDVDVLSVHVPLSGETRGLLGADELRRMRPDSLLVNTSRGGVVDEEALDAALRSRGSGPGQAVLDVFAAEGERFSSPLTGNTHVTLTPHMAGMTGGAMRRASEGVVDVIARHLRGDALP